MRVVAVLVICFALLAHWGCRPKTDGGSTRPGAPTAGAPRGKVAIEAPAEGSARDAKVSPANDVQSKAPGDADPSRKYQEGVTEGDLGLPFYPGSKELRPGARISDSSGTAVQSFRVTDDPIADVVGFYRKRLDVLLHEVVDANSTTVVGRRGALNVTIIAIQKGNSTEINVFTRRPKSR
jgi:hypothetical protein